MEDVKLQHGKRRYSVYPLVTLALLLSVVAISFGDLMEIIPLFTPLLDSAFFRIFHEVHDLLAILVALFAAYRYQARLGIAAVLVYLLAHIPYAIVEFQELEGIIYILFTAFVAFLGVWLIDRLHKTEKRERQAQEYLQLQVERMPIGLIVWDTDFRVQSWNPAAEKIFGFSREEALGKHSYDLIVPKNAQSDVNDIWHRLLKGDMTAHSINENTMKDGRTITCDWSNTPLRSDDGKVLGVLSMVQDITERKLAEERTAHLTAVLKAIRNVNQLITREKDREVLIQKSCEMLVQREGYEKAWILLLDERKNFVTAASTGLGKDTSAFMIQLETGNYPVCVRELLNQEQLFLAFDRPGNRHIGCILASEHSNQGIFRCKLEYDGKLYGVLGVALPSRLVFDKEEQDLFLELCGDIALALANVESVQKVQAAEQRYRTVIQTSIDGFLVVDSQGHLLDVNDAYCRLMGYSRQELLKMTIEDVEAVETRGDAVYHLQQIIESGGGRFETKHRCRDGSIVDLDISVNYQSTASLFFYFLRDITEQKRMQEQLMVTDRLASIGQLASGIAHELNNPLTGVIGFSELLLQREDLPPDVKEDLKTVNNEARRTANVVKGLLTFVRKQTADKEPVDIQSIIEGVLRLRSYEQRVSNIEVDTQFADLPRVVANGAQLQQVFINIIINAEQAMLEAHSRGKLTVITKRVGDTVQISFADDGPGISQENMRKLFSPFFTTKEVGKGTGLGLSICHGIVTEHGGKIYARSESGKGTTFVVELPIK